MQTILILTLDGVLDASLGITLDTLKAGRSLLAGAGKAARVRVLTAGYAKTIRTGAGLRLTTDMTFREVVSAQLRPSWVVLPGAGLSTEEQIAARFSRKDAVALMELLRALAAAKVRIATSCSSVFFLAQAGLLSGRAATTTWWLAPIFRGRYADVRLDESKMLVRDGQYLSSGSAFSQMDLMLAVVTDTMGAGVAHLCSRYLLIDERPSQARYMIPNHIQQVDATVIAAERWIDEHLAMPVSVAALASQLAMSPRTLARRIEVAMGVSPVKFIQRRKLLHAVHLLETSSRSIDAIARDIGYQDATTLRKLIRREFGMTPGAMR